MIVKIAPHRIQLAPAEINDIPNFGDAPVARDIRDSNLTEIRRG